MLIDDNGVVRAVNSDEMGAETETMTVPELPSAELPLTQMAIALSTANSLAAMRAAAKEFLEKTESAE